MIRSIAATWSVLLTVAAAESRAEGVSHRATDRAIAEGKVKRAVSIRYFEEHPSESELEVVISPGGDAEIATAKLGPDCFEPWERKCWTRSRRKVRLSARERTEILAASARVDFARLPNTHAAMPGGSRLELVVGIEGQKKLQARTSVELGIRDSGIAALRKLLLALEERQ